MKDAYQSSGTSPTVGEGFSRSGNSPTQSDLPTAVNPTDILIQDHGSVVLLVPETDAGRAWVEENIGRENGFQPFWPTVLAEPRYVTEIVLGARRDGLRVGEN